MRQNFLAMPRHRLTTALVLVLLAVPLAVFFPTLEAGFLRWDDDVNVYENPRVQGLTGENLAWMFTDFAHALRYKPLAWLGWAVIHEVFGLNPFGYHLANLALHLANTVLVFWLLCQLFRLGIRRTLSDGESHWLQLCSGLGALLWAVHPLRVEPVAWVTGFPYHLSLCFLLFSLLAYLRAQVAEPGNHPRWWHRGSVLAFALAVLSYPIVLGALAAFVAIDFFPLRRFHRPGGIALWDADALRVWREKLPWLTISALLVVVTLFGRLRASDHWIAAADLGEFGVGARFMQACYVWAYYLWKPWVPADLCAIYTTLVWNRPGDLPFVVSLLAVAGITLAVAVRWRRWPAGAAGWLAYLGLLVPLLGLTERPHYPHDRYGLVVGILWAMLAAGILWRLGTSVRGRAAAFAGGLLVAVWCSWVSARQTQFWQGNRVFFEHLVTQLADNEFRNLAFLNLGDTLAQEGEDLRAVAAYERAARPDVPWVFPFDFQRLALNHGAALSRLHRWPDAVRQFEIALGINPANLAARNYCGLALSQLGRHAEALAQFQAAVQVNPNHAETRLNLGLALTTAKQFEAAIGQLTHAARLAPELPTPHELLAQLHGQLGRTEAARIHAAEARRLGARPP